MSQNIKNNLKLLHQKAQQRKLTFPAAKDKNDVNVEMNHFHSLSRDIYLHIGGNS